MGAQRSDERASRLYNPDKCDRFGHSGDRTEVLHQYISTVKYHQDRFTGRASSHCSLPCLVSAISQTVMPMVTSLFTPLPARLASTRDAVIYHGSRLGQFVCRLSPLQRFVIDQVEEKV